MALYVEIDNNNQVIQVLEQSTPPSWGGTFFSVQSPPNWTDRKEFHNLFYLDGAFFWQDSRNLEELKTAKKLEINESRLKANRTTFTFGGKQVSCDELSRSDIDAVSGIISLTGALPPNWLGGWKAVDNTYISIPDVASWIQFFGAMVAQGTTNFVHAQTLKTQLATATTVAEIAAITW